MRAGRLRTKITIESKSTSTNSVGEPIITWTSYLNRWAEALEQSGREFQATAQRQADVSNVFRIRYTLGLSPSTHRVKVGTRLFDIVSVIDVGERHEETQLACVEAVA